MDHRGLVLAIPFLLAASCEKSSDPSVIVAEARVTDVSVQILESFPVQARAVVRGELPDGCTVIESIAQSREGNEFRLRIMTSRPSDLSCTQGVVPFEEVIPLDVLGLSAGEYRVLANGVLAIFRLDVDNVPH
jgi:inhibitor of cysteine peptidase